MPNLRLRSIDIPKPIEKVFERFHSAGMEIFLIGAGSRSLLQGKKAVDCDFTTNATPGEIQKLLPHSFYNNIYGTVGIHIKGVSGNQELYEITTYRAEGRYTDRRHPDEIRWGKKLEEDLARRSFTISAIAIGPERKLEKEEPRGEGVELVRNRHGGNLEIVDLYDGKGDLERKIIKAIGNPHERFQEDALRLMRAVRIATQLSFIIDQETFAAIKRNADLLETVAQERIRDEFCKILASNYPADGVVLLANSDLLEKIVPELTLGYGIEQTGHHQDDIFTHSVKSLKHCPSKDPLVRLAALLHDVGKVSTRAYLCQQCQFKFTEETRVGQMVICPRCGHGNNAHQATTFYNHEVAGGKIARKIAQRLKFSKEQEEKLVILVRWHQFSVDEHQTDKAIRRFIRRVGKENVQDIIDLRVGDRIGSGVPPVSWRLEKFLKKIAEVQKQPFTVTDLKVNGHDVMEVLGIKPGPRVGEVLNHLFAEVEEDVTRNTREYLIKRLGEIGSG